jgi:hypothetical protein
MVMLQMERHNPVAARRTKMSMAERRRRAPVHMAESWQKGAGKTVHQSSFKFPFS